MKAAYITDHHQHISVKIQGKRIAIPFLPSLLTVYGGRQAASTRPHASQAQEMEQIAFQLRYVNETFKHILGWKLFELSHLIVLRLKIYFIFHMHTLR